TVARADFPPTHRDRIAGLPATTIHRLLAYSPRRGYGHDENHPVPYDVVIIDETSTVSLTLMARLLAGAPPQARLVLSGAGPQLHLARLSRHHRRDVGVIADPDGAAARRGAPTGPARARRRRPPTRLRRRRGGPRRPRRRAGRARREPGRRAHGDPALRFPHP